MRANVLRDFEVDLESTDEIDVKGVEVIEKRLESEPVPRRNSAGELLTAALGALVIETYTIVEVRYFDSFSIRRKLFQSMKKFFCARREVVSDLDDRNDLPVIAQGCIESAERVSDSSPFLHGELARVAAVNDVPYEAADYAKALPFTISCRDGVSGHSKVQLFSS
jgi:hypothetical protein